MMKWLLYPAGIAVGIVVLAPIFVAAVIMVVVGGALHTVGHTVGDWIIDLDRRADAWTRRGDTL